MKKLLALLFSVLMISALCIPAFADVGGPVFREYECMVSNPDGTDLYCEHYNESTHNYDTDKEHLSYGTKLTLTGEYTGYFLQEIVIPEGEKGVGYVSLGKKNGYVSMADIAVLNNQNYKTDITKYSIPQKKRVVPDEGIDILSGPSKLFDVTGRFEKDEIITITHIENETNCYFYAKGNGKEGWIYYYPFDGNYTLSSLVSTSDYTGKIIVNTNNVHLKNVYAEGDSYDEQELSESIPIGTELTFTEFLENPKDAEAYTEYNGIKGWVTFDGQYPGAYTSWVITYRDSYMISSDDAYVYTERGDIESKTDKVIPAYTFLRSYADYYVLYTDDDSDMENCYAWSLVDYEGEQCWTASRMRSVSRTSSYPKITLRNGTLPIYTLPDKASEQIGTLEAGKKVQSYCSLFYDESFYYIIDGDTAGWIQMDYEKMDEDYLDASPLFRSFDAFINPDKENKAEEEEEEKEETGAVGAPVSEESVTEKTTAENIKAPTEPKKIIIACLIGAAILAATAAVTAILISRKKKG